MDNFRKREYNRVLSVDKVLIMCWLLKNRVNLRCKCNELFEIVRKFKVFEAFWFYRYYVIYVLYFYWHHIVCIILSWQLHFWTMCNYPINRGVFYIKTMCCFSKMLWMCSTHTPPIFFKSPLSFSPLSPLLHHHFLKFFLNHQIVQVFLPF